MATVVLGHILVPTDFGETSRVALRYGLALAERFGARVHLLHAVQNPLQQPWAAEIYAVSTPDFEAEALREADAQLAAMARDASPAGRCVCLVTESGPPFPVIVGYAQREPIDLIVMGTHGRGAVAHMLIGSVAEHVVRKAPCPVLTVRHPEREFVEP